MKSSVDNNIYISSTTDLKRRFQEHNNDKVKSTKDRRPFEIVYYESYKSKKDAKIREQNLKLKNRAFQQLKKQISNNLL